MKYVNVVRNHTREFKLNHRTIVLAFFLEIPKGLTTVVTGPGGCGKSTALKLLMCVCSPDRGEWYYRNREGRRHKHTSAYRRFSVYAPHGNALMNGTIREIVGFAAELEEGADTLPGERGTGPFLFLERQDGIP